jgi:uncharacterized protein YndB with AHSA1/START domain
MSAGDQVRVSVLVRVDPERAFQAFTEQIDQWWRRGMRYRVAAARNGAISLEPGVGGRLFESFETDRGVREVVTGHVTHWDPPRHLAFDWRAVNFKETEVTHVDIRFSPRVSGTMVTIQHSGWSQIRLDHPARHGLETAAFLRMMGLWWGDLMTAFREYSADWQGTQGTSGTTPDGPA